MVSNYVKKTKETRQSKRFLKVFYLGSMINKNKPKIEVIEESPLKIESINKTNSSFT